jgi:hypothetical protein
MLQTEMPIRARRVRTVTEPLVTDHGPADYTDAYTLQGSATLAGTAEEFARAGLEGCNPVLRRAIRLLHHRVLGLRLAPADSPDHIIGWRIVTNELDVIHLEAAGPIGHSALVCRRVGAGAASVQTFLWFDNWVARPLWALVGSAHRGVTPRLMERVARERPAR